MTHSFEHFHYTLTIKEHHLDTFGHVNHATYLSLFEEARWEFVTTRGFGLQKMQSEGVGPIILECKIRFLKEICLRETITIDSVMRSYEKRIGTIEQTMRSENDIVHCTAEMKFGFLDLNARKLILPPNDWLKAIGIQTHL